MIFIKNVLDFTLYKHNNIELLKNSVAYFKKVDKILFEVENSAFELEIHDKEIYFKKESDEYIFLLDSKRDTALLTLKKENISFDIKVEYISVSKEYNKYAIIYKLESDEEETKIDLLFYN